MALHSVISKKDHSLNRLVMDTRVL